MTYACLTEDVASILHTLAFGVYDPLGSTGNIFEEDSPPTPVVKTVLYQIGGLKREPTHRGDIRYPRLHIEAVMLDKLEALEKVTRIVDALNGKTFQTTKAVYFFELQGEPAPNTVSRDNHKGTVNFIVRQVIK